MPASPIRKAAKTAKAPARVVKAAGKAPTARRVAAAPAPVIAPPAGKAVQTRQKILDAAAALLASRGFTGTSLNDIAKAADMKSGSLYFHFASKDELITEILHEGMAHSTRSVDEAIAALDDKAGVRERLCAAVRAHIASLHRMASYSAALIRIIEEVTPEIRASFRDDEGRYSTCWRTLIEEAQAEGLLVPGANPRHIRAMLFAAMNATSRFGSGAEGAEQGAQLVIKLFDMAPRARRKA